ncbi:FeoB-associated Cys-rich membrane protein [Parapedobacter lycopersici]|uniref:FeoB-associated Cys-rich membrane protein n=1 Tax=Parapedobacter lycopersici TaxID=1864939 RepID=UPI003557E50A
MDAITIQYLIIGTLFVVALVYLIRRTRRSFKGGKSCSKGCGCAFTEKTEPLNTSRL